MIVMKKYLWFISHFVAFSWKQISIIIIPNKGMCTFAHDLVIV